MRTLQNAHAPFDRISTREELDQVLQVLLDLQDGQPTAGDPYYGEIEMDSNAMSVTFAAEAPEIDREDLLNRKRPLTELLLDSFERIN